MSDAFVDTLQQHHQAMIRFVELLESEQTMLTGGASSVEALSRLTERKAAQARELEALDARRRAILAARGHSSDRTGSERLAEALGCSELWQSVVTDTENARVLNQINGVAIGNRLDLTNRTLSFLQRAAGQTVYGPNGRARSLASSYSVHNGA